MSAQTIGPLVFADRSTTQNDLHIHLKNPTWTSKWIVRCHVAQSHVQLKDHEPITIHIQIPPTSPFPILLPFPCTPLPPQTQSPSQEISIQIPSLLCGSVLRMAANTLMSCCGVATPAFPSVLSSSKSKFAASIPLPAAATSSSSRFSMSAEWMPGQPRPPYLDGSAPG